MMTDKDRQPLGINLTGTMMQTNITLFLALLVSIGLVSYSPFLPTEWLRIVAAIAGVAGCVVTLGLAVYSICRKPDRPSDGQQTSVKIHASNHAFVEVHNPPDALIRHDEITSLVRLMMSGIDPNLEPDGEVIGNASDGNARPLTPHEKETFRRANQAAIGAKFDAPVGDLLGQGEAERVMIRNVVAGTKRKRKKPEGSGLDEG